MFRRLNRERAGNAKNKFRSRRVAEHVLHAEIGEARLPYRKVFAGSPVDPKLKLVNEDGLKRCVSESEKLWLGVKVKGLVANTSGESKAGLS